MNSLDKPPSVISHLASHRGFTVWDIKSMILSIYPTGFQSGICPTKQGRWWVHVASNTSYNLFLFVCSEDAYRASREHTMSVVLGDDLVPRLSIQTMQDLKVSVMTAINDCPHPKVIYKYRCCKCIIKAHAHYMRNWKKMQVSFIQITAFFTTATIFPTVLYMSNDFNNNIFRKFCAV